MPFSGYQDFLPTFSGPLQQFLAARPGITVGSGYRTPEHQAELYQAAIRKYGSEKAARHNVAPPGRSFHNKRLAADLAFASPEDKAWAHANAAKYNLVFPMGHEPWHVELAGARNGGGGGDSGGAIIALDDSTAPLLADALNPSPYKSDLSALASSAMTRLAGGDSGGQPRIRETKGDRDTPAPLLETETVGMSPESLAARNTSAPELLTNPPPSLSDLFRVRPIGQAGTPPTLPGRRF